MKGEQVKATWEIQCIVQCPYCGRDFDAIPHTDNLPHALDTADGCEI